MRYAIISDIHGNLEALESVLSHIRSRGISTIYCLGDIVGYGPNPLECTELVMENCDVSLRGNHDEALLEGIYLFNSMAKGALLWSREIFQNTEHAKKEEMWKFLEELPYGFHIDNYSFVHGSPIDPTTDYILTKNLGDEKKFHQIFSQIDHALFCGHTHLPCVITDNLTAKTLQDIDFKYFIEEGEKAIINVGSVGQSRDNDPRASYTEVIDNMVFFHRIEYDYQKVADKIFANPQLHDYLGERLMLGK